MSGTDEIVAVTVVDDKPLALGTLRVSLPQDVVTQATEIARVLAGLIEEHHLYEVIGGKVKKRFVRVEGWMTLATMLGLAAREVSCARQEDGGYVATVEIVRVSDGFVLGRGSALCGMDEERWATRAEYARRSMAITRATGKALRILLAWIVALAGYDTTPAEEIVAEESVYDAASPPIMQHSSPLVNRPWSPDMLRRQISIKIGKSPLSGSATEKQYQMLAMLLNELLDDAHTDLPIDELRHELLNGLCNKSSVTELTKAEASVLIDWAKSEHAQEEAIAVLSAMGMVGNEQTGG